MHFMLRVFCQAVEFVQYWLVCKIHAVWLDTEGFWYG